MARRPRTPSTGDVRTSNNLEGIDVLLLPICNPSPNAVGFSACGGKPAPISDPAAGGAVHPS